MLLWVKPMPEPIIRASGEHETAAQPAEVNTTLEAGSGLVPSNPGVGSSGERSCQDCEALGPIGGSPWS